MINVRDKICLEDNCNIHPYYGNIGEKAIYCAKHKKENMIDVKSILCKSCGLFQVKKQTNYLCSYCNPDKSQKTLRKEIVIKELLHENEYTFIHNKQFENECCLKYRPDFLFNCGTYYLILEVDEDAHSGYANECEVIRMNNISSGLGLPTLFIRYNPDLKGISKKTKHIKLLDVLSFNLNLELLEDPSPIYLFYPAL